MARSKAKQKQFEASYPNCTVNLICKETPTQGRVITASVACRTEASQFDIREQEGIRILAGDRKWLPIRIKSDLGMRVTKNADTAECRITISLSRRIKEQMTPRLRNSILDEVEELILKYGREEGAK